MDGLFHGKPYEQMDDLGGFPLIFGSTTMLVHVDIIPSGQIVIPLHGGGCEGTTSPKCPQIPCDAGNYTT